MSERGPYRLAGMALFFAAAAGVAIGARMLMDEKRPLRRTEAPKETATILQFKPRG